MGLFKDCGCGCNGTKQKKKFVIALVMSLLFFVISNPYTYRVVRRALGSFIASPTGCPTQLGVVVHTGVFFLLAWGMMNIQKERYELDEPVEKSPSSLPAVIPLEKVQTMPRVVVEAPAPTPLPLVVTPKPSMETSNMITGSPTPKPSMETSNMITGSPTPMPMMKPKPSMPMSSEPVFEPLDGKFSVGCIDLNTDMGF